MSLDSGISAKSNHYKGLADSCSLEFLVPVGDYSLKEGYFGKCRSGSDNISYVNFIASQQA